MYSYFRPQCIQYGLPDIQLKVFSTSVHLKKKEKMNVRAIMKQARPIVINKKPKEAQP